MRHLNKGRSLGRTDAHRVALGRNLALALVNQFGQENREYIVTTPAKAKEYRGFIERLITLGKHHNVERSADRKLAIRRHALELLPKPAIVKKIFDEIAPRYADRKGGYVRVIKTGAHRLGDGSQKALLAFVAGVGPVAAAAAGEAAEAKPAVKPAKPEKGDKKE
ncbi:50S ribosomal protein L17 [bacterium]|nr:50S ribosomal protein L17 [bacterium]